MQYLLTPVSGNRKTGPIAVTTNPKQTCPPACPFRKGGCYAATGAINIHWLAVSRDQAGTDYDAHVKALSALPSGQLARLNQAGDLAGIGNRIDGTKLRAMILASKGKRFFTYTHKPVLGESQIARNNRSLVAEANKEGLAINLSGNNLEHADQLKALGIAPVVCVLPIGSPDTVQTPAGHKVVKCPAQTREYVTCATCKLCAQGKRNVIVGFEAHGNAKRRVSQVAAGV